MEKGDLPQTISHGTSIAQNFTGAQQNLYPNVLYTQTHRYTHSPHFSDREQVMDQNSLLTLILCPVRTKNKINSTGQTEFKVRRQSSSPNPPPPLTLEHIHVTKVSYFKDRRRHHGKLSSIYQRTACREHILLSPEIQTQKNALIDNEGQQSTTPRPVLKVPASLISKGMFNSYVCGFRDLFQNI